MKLELKHLAPYLPYRLKILDEKSEPSDNIFTLESVNIYESVSDTEGNIDIPFIEIKPILRPLSDLTKEIEVNGEEFVPLDVLTDLSGYDCLEFDLNNVLNQPYTQIQKLFEWHFDVFGLIEQGLAISIHDVGQADA